MNLYAHRIENRTTLRNQSHPQREANRKSNTFSARRGEKQAKFEFCVFYCYYSLFIIILTLRAVTAFYLLCAHPSIVYFISCDFPNSDFCSVICCFAYLLPASSLIWCCVLCYFFIIRIYNPKHQTYKNIIFSEHPFSVYAVACCCRCVLLLLLLVLVVMCCCCVFSPHPCFYSFHLLSRAKCRRVLERAPGRREGCVYCVYLIRVGVLHKCRHIFRELLVAIYTFSVNVRVNECDVCVCVCVDASNANDEKSKSTKQKIKWSWQSMRC